jgi:hypothetical protein
MRSPIGPILVILGLATVAVLVLLLIQTSGLRGDVEAAYAEVGALRAQVADTGSGVTASELQTSLDELEGRIETLVSESGSGTDGDPSQPAGGGGTDDAVADRLDEILDRIGALDYRIDEICDSVPVC